MNGVWIKRQHHQWYVIGGGVANCHPSLIKAVRGWRRGRKTRRHDPNCPLHSGRAIWGSGMPCLCNVPHTIFEGRTPATGDSHSTAPLRLDESASARALEILARDANAREDLKVTGDDGAAELKTVADAAQRSLDAALKTVASFRAERDRIEAQRDRLQRLFNRLEAAITHHKTACQANDVPDTHDEALWGARDRVLKDASEGNG